ncbi:Uncharacterized protein M6B38_231905 [Iris pallida]|uniref:Uncharacterized protein n=1 Tax=Iris pallida TaxID=29817 RepID=A0AAX6DRL3_IRIPA|nr:Uncharacterized protein M6B38_231905 [Iris pallida]
MNSFTGSNSQKPPSPSPSSFSSYQFDFGVGSAARSSSSRPLRENPKPANAPAYGSVPYASTPNKPSWTHQPAPGSAPGSAGVGSGSMVGDIFGRSWTNSAKSASEIGIPKSNPNLFGDLVGSALNQNKPNPNVPLKAAAPRNPYSMGNLSDSLPKSNPNPTGATGSVKPGWGPSESLRNFSSLGGQPMKSGAPSPAGAAAASNDKRDPFGSLVDFGSKSSGKVPISSARPSSGGANSPFSAFQSSPSAGFGTPSQNQSKPADFSFGGFQNAPSAGSAAPAQKPQPRQTDFSFGEFKNAEKSDFGMPSQMSSAGVDPLDVLFSSSGGSKEASGSQTQFSETNDWDVGAEFGDQDHSATTTELEGLPPPPAGVTAPMAASKGMDNYKQGQYADAIKWLSWAVVLIEKSGDSAASTEVLTCRASCYKEVGEYKKAVADCSKVLGHDSENVAVLLQRALLYESTEKYRLGAEDLRMVLKIDPSNRLAKSTIHRLNKMAD